MFTNFSCVRSSYFEVGHDCLQVKEELGHAKTTTVRHKRSWLIFQHAIFIPITKSCNHRVFPINSLCKTFADEEHSRLCV